MLSPKNLLRKLLSHDKLSVACYPERRIPVTTDGSYVGKDVNAGV